MTRPSTSAAPHARLPREHPGEPWLRPLRALKAWLVADLLEAEWREIGEEAAAIAHRQGRTTTSVDDVALLCLESPTVRATFEALGLSTVEVARQIDLRLAQLPPDADRAGQPEGATYNAYQRVLMVAGRDRGFFSPIDRMGLFLCCALEPISVVSAVTAEAGWPLPRLLLAVLFGGRDPAGDAEVVVDNDAVSNADAVCEVLRSGLRIPHHFSHPLMQWIGQNGSGIVYRGERAECEAVAAALLGEAGRLAPTLSVRVVSRAA